MSKNKCRVFSVAEDKLNYQFEYNNEETSALHEELNGTNKLTIDDLRRVSLWKSNRIMSVSDELLEDLVALSLGNEVSLDDEKVKLVIERLVESQGFGYPMASSVLKFINPNVFPIIDVRAYRALTGRKLTYSTYSFDIYLSYAKHLTEMSKKLKRPLKDIDEQLYEFDKKFNQKI